MFLAALVYRGIALATVSPIFSRVNIALGRIAHMNTNRHVLSLISRSSKFYNSITIVYIQGLFAQL